MKGLSRKAPVQKVRETGLVAIIRGNHDLPQMQTIAEPLLEGGVRISKVTLNSDGVLGCIALIRQHFGSQSFVGAGTVRTVLNDG
jgi:2-keto-3-deoxy-6-phosphogluconate aldolase